MPPPRPTARFAEIRDLPTTLDGVARRVDLLRAGLSSGTINNWRQQGLLVARHPGVYLLHGIAEPQRQELRAALLAAPGTVLSHTSAAHVHGLRCDGSTVHLVADRQVRRRLDGVMVHRTSSAVLARRRTVDGLPVTAVPDTVLDCASLLPSRASRELLADALRRGLTTRAAVRAARDERPRLPGTACLGELLADPEAGRVASWLEARGLALLRSEGLRPEVNAAITDRGRLLARGDLVFRAQRLVIELDGVRFHATPAEKAADDRRQNALVAAGWTVLRYSWADLRQRPDAFVSQVAALVAESRVRSASGS